MFSVADFLDRAKAGAGAESDYRLAKIVGITHSAVSGYRHGRSMPDERAIMKLCAFSGDDPAEVVATLFAMRAANDDAAGLWRQVAARLKAGGQNVLIPGAIAMILIAASPDAARAGALFSSDFLANSAYYVKCWLAVRLAMRLTRLALRSSSNVRMTAAQPAC